MQQEVLRSLLIDVAEQGSAVVRKRKILWMLGRSNDTPTVWRLLLEEWEEIGESRASLFGVQRGEFITLVSGEPQNIDDSWAG